VKCLCLLTVSMCVILSGGISDLPFGREKASMKPMSYWERNGWPGYSISIYWWRNQLIQLTSILGYQRKQTVYREAWNMLTQSLINSMQLIMSRADWHPQKKLSCEEKWKLSEENGSLTILWAAENQWLIEEKKMKSIREKEKSISQKAENISSHYEIQISEKK